MAQNLLAPCLVSQDKFLCGLVLKDRSIQMMNLVMAEFLSIIAYIFLPPLDDMPQEAYISMLPFSNAKSTLTLSIEAGSFMELY